MRAFSILSSWQTALRKLTFTICQRAQEYPPCRRISCARCSIRLRQLAIRSLPALSLNADIAALTAISNDYSYDEVFARILSGIVHSNDVVIGISTSGNSENVYRALVEAKKHGAKTIGLLGKTGGKIKDIADIAIIVPGDNTARIQESHIMIGHIICEIAEEDYE